MVKIAPQNYKHKYAQDLNVVFRWSRPVCVWLAAHSESVSWVVAEHWSLCCNPEGFFFSREKNVSQVYCKYPLDITFSMLLFFPRGLQLNLMKMLLMGFCFLELCVLKTGSPLVVLRAEMHAGWHGYYMSAVPSISSWGASPVSCSSNNRLPRSCEFGNFLTESPSEGLQCVLV